MATDKNNDRLQRLEQRCAFLEERLLEYREREKLPNLLGQSKLYVFHLLNEKGKIRKDWESFLDSRKTTSPVEWAMIQDLKMLAKKLQN